MTGPARLPSRSGALDRLPVRWQQRTRALRRRMGPVADAVARRARDVLDQTPWASTPLVSIVLPVYDVAEYLPDCLASLAAQTHPRLEIIAVDDGSPDDSIDILRAFAATDPRLRIIQQANAGLGAARNVGAAQARGAYLMFLDSDDVLLPGAVQRYVEVLGRTGSDFAVSLYQRLDASGPLLAAPWTRAAHRRTRERETLAQFPEVMVNAVAWSKCYRRSFWAAAGLRFPEGVLYEDQAVSARAYARATRFDVLADVTHQWRVRDDGRSITQQSTDVVDLRARFRAAKDSLDELRAAGAESAAEVRTMQLLSNDFPLSIRISQHADDDFWTVLRAGLQRLHRGVGPDQWARVPAQHRIAALLVERDLREETTEFLGLGHANPKNSPALLRDGQVYVQFGVRNALGLAADDPALALAETQIGVVAVLHRVGWRPGGRLELQGWAYLDNVDLGAAGVHLETRIGVVDLDDPDRPAVPLSVRPRPDPEVSAVSKHAYADYTPSTFVTEVDPTRLGGGRRFGFRIELSAGGISRTGSFGQLIRSGSGGALRGRVVAVDCQATPTFTAADGLVLTLTRPTYRLGEARTEPGGTRIGIDTDATPPTLLELEAAGGETVPVALKPDLPTGPAPAKHRVSGLLPALPSGSWTTRVVDPSGRRFPVAVPEQPSELALARLRTTAAGNLAPLELAGDVVVVDSVEVAGPAGTPALSLSGTGTLVAGTPLRLELRTPSGGTSVVVAVEANGYVAASIPLTADPWGFGRRVLPSATYDLVAVVDGAAETGGRVEIRVGDALLADLPVPGHRPDLRAKVQLRRPGGLQLAVRPPLDEAELGARPQRALQDGLARRLDHPEVEPGSVLLRSYYGEICGCNPLAVHQELRRLGTDHTIYWAVRDHSVVVPEGGIPVIYESAEWYRVLHQAEFYVDNMHQPLSHRKPPHQVQVQTFHGYPFKQMGVSHWRQQQRDVAHVRSYLARAADWDYLVSPASYGTAALCAEFGFPNEVLEIGYPRNDVLQDARAASLRVDVRRRLGIADHQTAVLYGPTFRDQLSRNDFMAAMIDFLDVAELSRLVGPDVVIMIRGHAFNARTADRVETSGNVVDVTDYPDIAGLCLASDAAVLDYSSLRFDYALTGRPMIFMVPDLETYLGRTRGSMFAFEPTAPGPFVSTTAEVAAAVADLDGVRARYAEPYGTFRRDYLDLDDGLAARRLVERVFLR